MNTVSVGLEKGTKLYDAPSGSIIKYQGDIWIVTDEQTVVSLDDGTEIDIDETNSENGVTLITTPITIIPDQEN